MSPPEPASGAWQLPAWAEPLEAGAARPSLEERMELAVALAARNVEEGSGGPFGAAVFERDSGALVAIGVNRVVASRCSHAHAEMVALARAQRQRGHHDLADPAAPAVELVTSCEPCAMCYGAVPGSGVRRLVCGARSADAEAQGFDEGEKPRRWVAALERRGIEVVRDVGRAAARKPLAAYRRRGGAIYLARRGS